MKKTTTLIILILVSIARSPAWAVPTGSDVEYIPYPRNLGIGVINPDTKLEIAGSTLNNRDGVPVYRSVAAYTNNATQTGTLKITLPKSWSSTSLQIKINGFAGEDQSSTSSLLFGPGISPPPPGKGAWELLIGGRNFLTDLPLCPFGPVDPAGTCTNDNTPSWTNTSAVATGILPFDTVRLAHDGTTNVILLGTTTSTWKSPQVQVTEVATGGSNILGWGDGWSVSFINDESSINSIKTPSLDVVLPAGASVNNLTATSTINGTTLIGDIVKVNQSLTAPYIVTPFVNGGFKGNGSELTKLNAATITGTLPNTVVSAADPWILVHSENFDTTPSGWSNNTTTSCAGHTILGGVNVLSTTPVFKSFDLSAYPHSQVKLKFNYYSIDSWDTADTTPRREVGFAKINDTISWASTGLTYNDLERRIFPDCGTFPAPATGAPDGRPDAILSGEAILEHNFNSVRVEFGSTLNEAPFNESYGIDNLEVWVKSSSTPPPTLTFLPLKNEVLAVTASSTIDNQFRTPSLVFTSPSVGYKFYSKGGTNAGRVVNAKTIDGGATWLQDRGEIASVSPGGPIVWYDQWTPGNSTGNKIYFLNSEGSVIDLAYREFDTSTDTVTAPVAIRSNTGGLTNLTRYSVTQASDGVKYIGVLDATAGSRGVFKCANNCGVVGTNWVNTVPAGGVNPITGDIDDDGDDIMLRPLLGGRILMIAWDSLLNKIHYSIYNGTTWTSLTFLADANIVDTSSLAFRSAWGAVTERSTGDVYFVFNTQTTLFNGLGTIKTFVFSDSQNTWTPKANVTSGDGFQTDIAIDENTGDLYAIFIREDAQRRGTGIRHFEAYKSVGASKGALWEPMSNINLNDRNYAGIGLNQSSPHLIGAFLRDFNSATKGMSFIKLNP